MVVQFIEGKNEKRALLDEDSGSILYRAIDKESGQQVALRRVCGGDELAFIGKGESEKKSFLEMLELLKEAEGEGFRKVYDGGIDSVDQSPWVAYEWLEGRSFVHEPSFEGSSEDLRISAMRSALKCLAALHSAELRLGWLGFENFFLNSQQQWIIELRPERMAIAQSGGVEVSHSFAPKLLQSGEAGTTESDLRGLRPLFAMLVKGTADLDNRVVLSSEWMRYLGWIKRRENISAREALARLDKIQSKDVLDAVSEIRKKNRGITQQIPLRAPPTQQLQLGGHGAGNQQVTAPVKTYVPRAQPKKSKMPVIFGLIFAAVILVLFVIVVQKSGEAPQRSSSSTEES